MLFRKFVFQTAAFAMLSALLAGNAQAQTKATVNRTATTSPLVINLGSGATPAAAGVKRLAFTTAALTMDFVAGAPAANVAGVKRQAFTTAALTMNFVAGAPAANVAGVKRQAFTTAVLSFDLGSKSAPQADTTKRAATTQPLVITLK